ncbi:MAG: hypothetical protein WC839_04130 [Candidatus Paceibacterota bacterium]
MILQNIKLLIGISVLLIYISIGVFGLFSSSHSASAPMTNCPYTQNGSSICNNFLEHINDWHQFSSVTLFSSIIFLLLILGIILYFFNQQNFLKEKQFFYKWEYYINDKKSYSFQSRIIKWLSLFENSPSFYIGA